MTHRPAFPAPARRARHLEIHPLMSTSRSFQRILVANRSEIAIRIFRACNDASKQAMLDFGSAATCSFGYEALLSRHFDGDFGRLLAWWNSERATEVD